MLAKIRRLVAGSALALALLTTFSAHTIYAATSYSFGSTTAEVQALGGSLASTAWEVVFYAIQAFIVIAVALMGAAYVWVKFKKFTGMKKKL